MMFNVYLSPQLVELLHETPLTFSQQQLSTTWSPALQSLTQCAGVTMTMGPGGLLNNVTAQICVFSSSLRRREHIQGYRFLVSVKSSA